MNQGSLLKWVLPLEIIYPFYVVFTALSGTIFTKLKSENGKWSQSN